MDRVKKILKDKKMQKRIAIGAIAALLVVLLIAALCARGCSSHEVADLGVSIDASSSTFKVTIPDTGEAESENASSSEESDDADEVASAAPESPSGETGASSGNGSWIGSDNIGSTGAQTDTPTSKVWVEDTEQVWVVDQEAWTEQVPVYATSERSVCNICSADITGNTYEHGKAHMLAGEGSGHHSEVTQYVSHYETKEHAEVGHWEIVVVGGHWE